MSRSELREGDVAEDPPPPGSVDPGSLEEFLGNRLQRGQVDQHRKAGANPNSGHDGRPESRRRLAEPRLGQTFQSDLDEKLVEKTELWVVDPAPDQRHSD